MATECDDNGSLTMQTTNHNTKHFPWAKLPEELKLMILEELISRSARITWKTHPIFWRMFLRSVLLTSKDFCRLALEMYTSRIHLIEYPAPRFFRPQPFMLDLLTHLDIKQDGFLWVTAIARFEDRLHPRWIKSADQGTIKELHMIDYDWTDPYSKKFFERTDIRKWSVPNIRSMVINSGVERRAWKSFKMENFKGCDVLYGPQAGCFLEIKFHDCAPNFRSTLHRQAE